MSLILSSHYTEVPAQSNANIGHGACSYPIPSTAETLLAWAGGSRISHVSIKLCPFVYKFISNIYYFNEIASSAPLIITRSQIDDTPSLPTQPKTPKTYSLKDILLEFRPITSVYYEPFKSELKQIARVFLPSSFP
jgi:hypothetical protein